MAENKRINRLNSGWKNLCKRREGGVQIPSAGDAEAE
jgi:hypothetical protein